MKIDYLIWRLWCQNDTLFLAYPLDLVHELFRAIDTIHVDLKTQFGDALMRLYMVDKGCQGNQWNKVEQTSLGMYEFVDFTLISIVTLILLWHAYT